MKFIVNSKYLERNIALAMDRDADVFYGRENDFRFISQTEVTSMIVQPTKNSVSDSAISGRFNRGAWESIHKYLQMIPEQPVVVEMDAFDVEISQHVACFKINF